MKLAITTLCLLIATASCSRAGGSATAPEILGVRLGAGRDETTRHLGEIGSLEKEERKQQEVWALRDHPSYSHLIVSYDKEYKGVRFVTAVAKEGGRPVRYEEVLNTGKAQRGQAGQSVTYTLTVQAQGGQPGYVVKAIGSPDHLKYYSVEKLD
jgi:hypothetical protein